MAVFIALTLRISSSPRGALASHSSTLKAGAEGVACGFSEVGFEWWPAFPGCSSDEGGLCAARRCGARKLDVELIVRRDGKRRRGTAATPITRLPLLFLDHHHDSNIHDPGPTFNGVYGLKVSQQYM